MKLPDNELRYVLLVMVLLAGLALYANVSHAATPGFSCDAGSPKFTPAWTQVMCWAQPYTPMVRDDADFAYPSGWIMQTNPTGPQTIRVRYQGWGDPQIDGMGATAGQIVIDNVYSHWPLDAWPDSRYKAKDWDWGGVLHGKNANGERLVATLNEISSRGYAVDYGAGIHLGGNCWGGSAAITQSLILPDPYWQSRITVVDTELGGMSANAPYGTYWKNPAAWNPYDITEAQHDKHLARLKNIYYRFRSSSYPADNTVYFDQNFLRDVCDKGRIACFATWGKQGHAWPDPEAPPAYQAVMNQLYSGPDMANRLDRVMVIFTHSTGNFYGERGHYNLGLEYRGGGVVDSANSLTVPIRYRAFKNLGAAIPNQPKDAIFTLTLRHPQAFTLKPKTLIRYTIGDVTGYAVPEEGEVTIPSVTLQSSEQYTPVTIEHVYVEGC